MMRGVGRRAGAGVVSSCEADPHGRPEPTILLCVHVCCGVFSTTAGLIAFQRLPDSSAVCSPFQSMFIFVCMYIPNRLRGWCWALADCLFTRAGSSKGEGWERGMLISVSRGFVSVRHVRSIITSPSFSSSSCRAGLFSELPARSCRHRHGSHLPHVSAQCSLYAELARLLYSSRYVGVRVPADVPPALMS